MSEPRQIATIIDYDGLHSAIRARADEIGITREQIDLAAEWPSGYASKILAPVPFKTLGRQSLGPMLAILGLKVILVEDPEAMAQITESGVRRVRAVRMLKPLQPGLANLPEIRSMVRKELRKAMQRNGKKGGTKSGASRKLNIPGATRRRIAKRAARIRWRRERERQAAVRCEVV